MSAICGILGLDGRPPPLDALERMMQAIRRHGPDGTGRWHDASVALGHQMMHITPESLDEQLPLHHGPSRIALTMDGRLDNREDLLRALGLDVSQHLPDSALVLAAYQKWGKDCAAHLVGEFALAVWDAGERILHCFTDAMGIRPLFCREAPGNYFAFASEVEPLLAVEPDRNPLNHTRLAMLGVSNLSVYLQPETTCFENIYRVPAASVLSVTGSSKRTTEYWAPDSGQRLHFRSDDECREAFQEVFFKAVKARLRSAFPVASLLSGGLDSSAIVSAASKLLKESNHNLITLSSVPMPEAHGQVVDERIFIDLFRAYENLEMHDVSAPGCGPFDEVEQLVKTAALCSYSYQHFLYTALVRVARESGARVILDGDGGELSASCYPRGYLAELLLAGHWKRLRQELQHSGKNGAMSRAAIKQFVLRPLLPYPVLKALKRHDRLGTLCGYPIREAYIQDILGQDLEGVVDCIYRLPVEYANHRRNMTHDILLEQRDLRQRSHAGFIGYQDARFSYPFLDKRVLEFAVAVDGRFKYRDGRGRQLLRLGMQGLLPAKILSRTSKAPFSPDYPQRYEVQKSKGLCLVNGFVATGRMGEIVDFDRVFAALKTMPAYHPEDPMCVDVESQFTVPSAVYLCYFLSRFGNPK